MRNPRSGISVNCRRTAVDRKVTAQTTEIRRRVISGGFRRSRGSADGHHTKKRPRRGAFRSELGCAGRAVRPRGEAVAVRWWPAVGGSSPGSALAGGGAAVGVGDGSMPADDRLAVRSHPHPRRCWLPTGTQESVGEADVHRSHLKGEQESGFRSAPHHDPTTDHVLFARLAQVPERRLNVRGAPVIRFEPFLRAPQVRAIALPLGSARSTRWTT